MNYLFCRSYFQPFFICCCVGYVACVMFINLNPPLLSAASLWFFPLLYLSAKYLINESTPTSTQEEEEEEENTELIIVHIIISNRKRKSRRKRVQFTHTHILIIFYKIAKTTTTISIASVTLIEKNCSIFHFNWGWKFIK